MIIQILQNVQKRCKRKIKLLISFLSCYQIATDKFSMSFLGFFQTRSEFSSVFQTQSENSV